tara:strand:+ start:362 stop:502 length:141 start_codon:yes stop_codon:yes gene_type:complete
MVWWIVCERCGTLVDEFEVDFIREDVRLCRKCCTTEEIKEILDGQE